MPVHRISGEYPSLKAAIVEYEKAGETVVQVVNWDKGWVVLTTAAPGLRAVVDAAGDHYEERVA